jgi:hypothetical protein
MPRLMPCRKGGCAANVDGGGYCAKHQPVTTDRTTGPLRTLYHSRGWQGQRTGLALAVRQRNPICQKLHVVGGRLIRCRYASALVHHMNGARLRPDLFFSVFDENGKSNLVALCKECHPEHRDETREWREMREGNSVPPGEGRGQFFVRTEWEVRVA